MSCTIATGSEPERLEGEAGDGVDRRADPLLHQAVEPEGEREDREIQGTGRSRRSSTTTATTLMPSATHCGMRRRSRSETPSRIVTMGLMK